MLAWIYIFNVAQSVCETLNSGDQNGINVCDRSIQLSFYSKWFDLKFESYSTQNHNLEVVIRVPVKRKYH